MKKILTLFVIVFGVGLANAQTLPTAQQIYDKYLIALGGKQKLESVKTLSYETVINIGEELKVKIETIKKGNKFKSIQTFEVEDITSLLFNAYNGKKNIQLFNGETGRYDGDYKKDFSDDQIIKMKKGKVMEALQIDVPNVKSVEKSQLEGKDYYSLTTDDGKMYFDIVSGLLYKNFTSNNEITVMKYIDVEGIKFVEEMKIKEGGKEVSARITKIMINKGVSDNDFE